MVTTNKTPPLVSIIVPSYNHENYISACLASIFEQSYPHIELIVLDDGSSDNSAAIIAEHQKANDFFFETHANMGLAATLNKGLSKATGDYIAIFASDDVMALDRIEVQVDYMEANPETGACGGNMLAIDDAGNILSKRKTLAAASFDFDDMFVKNLGGPPAPTAMIRQSAIQQVGGYNPDIAIEDQYMWLKLGFHGYRVAILENVLAYYRDHGENSHKKYEWMIENVKKIYADYHSHPEYSRVLDRFLTSMILKTAATDKKLARQLFKEVSWRYQPLKKIKGLYRLLAN